MEEEKGGVTQSDELKRLRDEVSSLQKDLKDTVRLEQDVVDLKNKLKGSRNEMDSLQKERKDLGVYECEVSLVQIGLKYLKVLINCEY